MDPTEEKKQDDPSFKLKPKRILAMLVVLLFAAIIGISFYFFSGSKHATDTTSSPSASGNSATEETRLAEQMVIDEKSIEPKPEAADNTETTQAVGVEMADPVLGSAQPEAETSKDKHSVETSGQTSATENIVPSPAVNPTPASVQASEPQAVTNISICNVPAEQLNKFYDHLDNQPYMAEYKLADTSEKHFTTLIQKLLANPPQVTRESDDLYTILKNTAHFFRISGKDNILMMKGILDHEKGSIEDILANYYLLVTTPECNMTAYAQGIDHAALYEYACFFLNTMGGRLYLFRRDYLSRMVVTYYAIFLVDQANLQNNNRHGIALKPVVDMLIAEMEAGGSSLKYSESYLDKLYDLKEKYQ